MTMHSRRFSFDLSLLGICLEESDIQIEDFINTSRLEYNKSTTITDLESDSMTSSLHSTNSTPSLQNPLQSFCPEDIICAHETNLAQSMAKTAWTCSRIIKLKHLKLKQEQVKSRYHDPHKIQKQLLAMQMRANESAKSRVSILLSLRTIRQRRIQDLEQNICQEVSSSSLDICPFDNYARSKIDQHSQKRMTTGAKLNFVRAYQAQFFPEY
ncbi:predicted protein [Chaetoceros tenuissimus]|uniref:Uncharacterized protein n=1 Tax=Chaetoceros tenuissimus TaxID=426638 RepID=A0AAD3CID9_9STRA|nr:predicted protein [Chaetoceros tenuissimus]